MQRGLNNQSIQQTNRSLVLQMIIDNKVMTRKELVEKTGLHKPTITNIVIELLELNIIEECEAPKIDGERRVKGFKIKESKIVILSARWVRTYFEIVAYSLEGKIIDSERCSVDVDEIIELTVNRIIDMVNRLVNRYGEEHVMGMCIGLPGPYIKGKKNEAIVAGYDSLRNIDVFHIFSDHFSFPIATEQDAHLSAFAEWKNMSTENRNECTCMMALQSIGIGIGAGVILEGKIVEGAFGVAGEIGQMGILFSGIKRENSSVQGSLETYASSASVKKYIRTRMFEFPNSSLCEESSYETIVQAYYAHDPLAEWAFDVVAWRLAYGLANVVFIMNPQEIIIGPDYPKTDRFIGKVQEALNSMLDSCIGEKIAIRFSDIDDDPTLEGGYYYVIDMFVHENNLFEKISEMMNK